MHCISCALKRKVEKLLLFKQTLKSRFDAKKSLEGSRKTILSGFSGSLSFFVSLPSRAISHARGHLRVLHFARWTTERRETACSLTLAGL